MLHAIKNAMQRRRLADSPVDFEGFWTDKSDATTELQSRQEKVEINAAEASLLQHFIQHGYVILKDAITPEHADALVEEIASTAESPKHYIARTQRKSYCYVTPDVIADKQFRLIDLHVNSELARRAHFAPAIHHFLTLLFEESVLTFQSLTFKYGSQRGIHQDSAYVVVDKALQFAASWIALEDVTAGSDELIYYPGSHRFQHYLFSKRYKSWLPERDGAQANQNFVGHLKTQIEQSGIEEQRYSPRKGDALIWAADLVHSGAKITSDATRHSLVTHYCPVSVKPNYTNFFTQYAVKQFNENGYYSSRHYDLTEHDSKSDTELATAARHLYAPVFMAAKVKTGNA